MGQAITSGQLGTLGTTQQTFVNTWMGEAQTAASELGISADNILAQWATESAWGTNTGATTDNNPGSIESNGSLVSYSSPSAFEAAYVSTIQDDFSQAENTGTNASEFVAGLANGAYGSYYGTSTTQSAYTSDIQSIAATLSGATAASSGAGTTGTTGTGGSTGGTNTSTTTTAAAPAGGASTNGVTAGWLSGLLPNVLIMALGLGLAYIGFTRTSAGQTVINTGKSAAKAAAMVAA